MTASTVPIIVSAAEQLEIDVDTLDVGLSQQLKSLGVQPNDMTSNQFIVADALASEENQLLLEQVIRDSPDADWLTILDRVVSVTPASVLTAFLRSLTRCHCFLIVT